MTFISRRSFVGLLATVPFPLLRPFQSRSEPVIMTVLGPLHPGAAGNTLVHEHILVDFIGARLIGPERWNRDEVIDKALPYLDEAKRAGCSTLADCTPNYMGRDVGLLRELARASGINIITNTGYYGGSDHKFLPAHALTETADRLSARWINEWKLGIGKERVKPGFIKISVNPGPLTDISRKLIRAAALTHIRTGLTIASHTGPAVAAMEQIAIIKKEKVDPSAFIWVHAQNEKDRSQFAMAAREGSWVSLDGLNGGNVAQYVEHLAFLREENCLSRVLVSHDAGWFEPGKPGGGEFRGFTTLFTDLVPALKQTGFTSDEISQITRTNPQNALTVAVRRTK